MKSYFLWTASGPLVILTTYDFIQNPELMEKLRAKGIEKFIAREVPIELAKDRYQTKFDVVSKDVHETDDMRVLDYSGERIFKNFKFKELGQPIYYDPD